MEIIAKTFGEQAAEKVPYHILFSATLPMYMYIQNRYMIYAVEQMHGPAPNPDTLLPPKRRMRTKLATL